MTFQRSFVELSFIIFVSLYLLACHTSYSYASTQIQTTQKNVLSSMKLDAKKADRRAEELQTSKLPMPNEAHLGFINAFVASIYVIIISELGDKTFFIAAIMSIQNSRVLVYIGAMTALASMTVLSAVMGFATTIVPRWLTYYLSGVLFAVFGFKMLYDAYKMTPEEAQSEFEEVKADLLKRKEEEQRAADLEAGILPEPPNRLWLYARSICSKVLLEAFVLTFLAEWGDRSQVTTIVLAATKDVAGVIAGGIIGHALCTGLAVIAGRIVAQKIPVRWLTAIGGITFLLFAVSTLFIGPDSNS